MRCTASSANGGIGAGFLPSALRPAPALISASTKKAQRAWLQHVNRIGVGPSDRTQSGCFPDHAAGVLILEKHGAEIAEG